MKHSKHLRLAGLLEILVGVLSIVAIQFLLKNGNDIALTTEETKNALADLMFLYGADAFKILAGLCGILLAGKKSVVTVVLGFLLFIAQLWGFVQADGDMVKIVINIILLAIPYYYLHNAYKVYKEA